MSTWTNEGILQGKNKYGQWCWYDDRNDQWHNDTKESVIRYHEYKRELCKETNVSSTATNVNGDFSTHNDSVQTQYPNGRTDGFVINSKSIEKAIEQFGGLDKTCFIFYFSDPPNDPPFNRFELMDI